MSGWLSGLLCFGLFAVLIGVGMICVEWCDKCRMWRKGGRCPKCGETFDLPWYP